MRGMQPGPEDTVDTTWISNPTGLSQLFVPQPFLLLFLFYHFLLEGYFVGVLLAIWLDDHL